MVTTAYLPSTPSPFSFQNTGCPATILTFLMLLKAGSSVEYHLIQAAMLK